MNVIVTGVSKGIGYHTLKEMLKDNQVKKVIGISRNISEISLEFKDNNKVEFISFDLESKQDDFNLLINKIIKKIDKVDILINNAGYLIKKKIEDISEEDLLKVYKINVFSLFYLIQKLIPYFNPESHIVNIGSYGGIPFTAKFPELAIYSTSKGAVTILSELLAIELSKYKININCINLGAVDTDMLKEAYGGNFGYQPKDIGKFIKNFAIDNKELLNGQIVNVTKTVSSDNNVN